MRAPAPAPVVLLGLAAACGRAEPPVEAPAPGPVEPPPLLALEARREVLAGRASGVLIEDLDGDGRPEVVLVAGTQDAQLLVWPGTRDPLRDAPARTPVGGSPLPPVGLGDGRVLCASREADAGGGFAVGLYTLDASGSLARAADTRLPRSPRALAAGDLGRGPVGVVAGDGELWVVDDGIAARRPLAPGRPTCAHVAADGSAVVLGFQEERGLRVHRADDLDGDAEPVRHLLGGIPRDLAEGDVDGDGDLELLVAGGDRSLWVFGLGTREGSASWRRPDASFEALEVPGAIPVFAGVTRAGAVVTVEKSALSWSHWPRGAALPTRGYCGQSPVAAALGDLDGDGRDDLLVANRDAGRLSVARGTAAGFVAPERAWAGRNPLEVRLADLDGDGDLDALALLAGAGALSVLANEGGVLEETQQLEIGPSPTGLVTGDLDGDGRMDVASLAQYAESARLVVFRGAAGGRLVRDAGPGLPAGTSAAGLAAADLDGDGGLEVAVLDGARDLVLVFDDLDGGAPRELPAAPGAVALVAADLGAAPGPELVTAGQGRGARGPSVRIAPLAGEALESPVAGSPVALATARLGGTAATDLVLLLAPSPTSSSRTAVAWIDADPSAATPAFQAGIDSRSLLAADVDGDGVDELFVPSRGGHNVVVGRALAHPEWGVVLYPEPALGADLGPMDVAAGDVDGDGRVDLVVANAFSEALSVILGR